jgi:hypothetical protein
MDPIEQAALIFEAKEQEFVNAEPGLGECAGLLQAECLVAAYAWHQAAKILRMAQRGQDLSTVELNFGPAFKNPLAIALPDESGAFF